MAKQFILQKCKHDFSFQEANFEVNLTFGAGTWAASSRRDGRFSALRDGSNALDSIDIGQYLRKNCIFGHPSIILHREVKYGRYAYAGGKND